MDLRLMGTMTCREAGLLNPLQLAYIGDAVWETIIRDSAIHRGLNLHHMHKSCVEYANAHAQASFLENMDILMNEQEKEIVKRGRNAHPHHPAPKNQNPGDYFAATGFEALIGFLYLTGQDDRIALFARNIIGGNENG